MVAGYDYGTQAYTYLSDWSVSTSHIPDRRITYFGNPVYEPGKVRVRVARCEYCDILLVKDKVKCPYCGAPYNEYPK